MSKRGLLFLFLQMVACSRSASSPETSTPKLPVLAPAVTHADAGAIRMVISVRKNSPGDMNAVSEYCILSATSNTRGLIYEGLPYRLDGVNLSFPKGISADLIEKSPALLVTLRKKADLGSVLVKTDRTCDPNQSPMAQARADFGTPECEQRSPCNMTLAVLAGFSYWEVSAVEAFSGLALTTAGETMQVKMTNVFPSRQAARELIAHYEGGPGKPMPQLIKFPVPELEPGAVFEIQMPRHVDETGKPVAKSASSRDRSFELYTLEMEGTLKDGNTEIPVHLNTFIDQLFPVVRD